MSLFQTRADTYQNSFANPMNPANMNPGWGIDPSLLTPSYSANYRPQYQGANPYAHLSHPGFYEASKNLFMYGVDDSKWGNPFFHVEPSVDSFVNRPADAAAWGMQRMITPMLAYGAAYKMLGPRNPMTGFFTGQGAGGAAGRWFGTNVASGFGRGLGLRQGGIAARGLTSAGALAGGMVGSIAAPIAAGTAMMWGAERGLFNPYINSRQQDQDLRDNFAGVTFSDSRGHVITGGGLGRRESSRMSNEITRMGIRDMMFEASDIGELADLSARSGMLDNVNSQQITRRMKDIADQVKLVVSISKNPDLRNAIEELAKLQMAGASLDGGQFSQAAQAYRRLGHFSAISGMSTQRLMNTVGAQGEYLYQANGMTPYLGQMAASSIIGSFSAAKRVGLMNDAQLARMGGIEGGTQASLTAQLNATKTPFSQMAMANSYLYGANGSSGIGPGQNTAAVVNTFGANASRDPTGTMGNLILHGDMMGGRLLDERGSLALEDQAIARAQSSGIRPGANGKYSPQQLAAVMQGMGLSPTDIRAYMNQRAAEQDPETFEVQMRALNRDLAEQQRAYIEQNFMYQGGLLTPVRRAKQVGRAMTESMANIPGRFTEAIGAMGDFTSYIYERGLFGGAMGLESRVSNYEDLFTSTAGEVGASVNGDLELIDTNPWSYGREGMSFGGRLSQVGRMAGGSVSSFFSANTFNYLDSEKVSNVVNKLAREGNRDARRFLSSSTSQADKRRALESLYRSHRGEFGASGERLMSVDNGFSNFDQYLSDVQNSGRVTDTVALHSDVAGPGTRFEKAIRSSYNDVGSGVLDSLQVIGSAYDLMSRAVAEGLGSQGIEDLLGGEKYAGLRSAAGSRTGSELMQFIQEIVQKGAQHGTLGISSMAFRDSETLQKYQENPALILNESIRKRFTDAKALGDNQGMQEALTGYLVDRRGGTALDAGLKRPDEYSLTELVGFQDVRNSNDTTRAKLYDLHKSNQINYSTLQQTINQLDQKETVKKFEDAVEEFGRKVDQMDGRGNPTNAGSPVTGSQGIMGAFMGHLRRIGN